MPSLAEILHNKGYRDFIESVETEEGRAVLKKQWQNLVLKNAEFYSINGEFSNDLSEALQKVSALLSCNEVLESRNEWWWRPIRKIVKSHIITHTLMALTRLKKQGIDVI